MCINVFSNSCTVLWLGLVTYYLTNKSFRVEHSDESHLSFESSSSAFPNQKLEAFDEVEAPLPLDEDAEDRFDLLPERPLLLRRNPSIAFPMMCGSTNDPLLSHRNLLRDFLGSLVVVFSSLSLNRSSTSFEKETVADDGFIDFLRAIGWCLFSNHPDKTAVFLSEAPPLPAVIICLALCRIDTSKLFERLVRLIPGASGRRTFDEAADDEVSTTLLFFVVNEVNVGGVSSILLISVAEEVSEDINDIRSVFDTIIPDFLIKFEAMDPPVETAAAAGDTISEARLFEGIGANVDPTKSE